MKEEVPSECEEFSSWAFLEGGEKDISQFSAFSGFKTPAELSSNGITLRTEFEEADPFEIAHFVLYGGLSSAIGCEYCDDLMRLSDPYVRSEMDEILREEFWNIFRSLRTITRSTDYPLGTTDPFSDEVVALPRILVPSAPDAPVLQLPSTHVLVGYNHRNFTRDQLRILSGVDTALATPYIRFPFLSVKFYQVPLQVYDLDATLARHADAAVTLAGMLRSLRGLDSTLRDSEFPIRVENVAFALAIMPFRVELYMGWISNDPDDDDGETKNNGGAGGAGSAGGAGGAGSAGGAGGASGAT